MFKTWRATRGILPVPRPLIAILFHVVPRLIFRRLFPSVLLQGGMFEAAVARVPIRKLSRHFCRGGQRSILVILASDGVAFPRCLLITVASGAIACRPVWINEAAIVFATAVADLWFRFAVPVNWNQVYYGKTAILDRFEARSTDSSTTYIIEFTRYIV